MTAATVNVLVASPLEADQVSRIAAADDRIRVLYAPDLLPVPRYPCDHTGVPPSLSASDADRWSQLRSLADVSFDFDWCDPAGMPRNCPRLAWVQATSAGIGGLLTRTGLAGTGIVFTTAAGVHGIPLAEFVLLGLLYFAKDLPGLTSCQRARYWERHHMGQLAGTRALLVGLGGVGRQVARLLAAFGVEVTGAVRPGRRYQVEGVTSYVTDTEIDSVLPSVDSLILACPLTERTHGLIGPRQLGLMRPSSVLVNVARGQVVDEDALADALAKRRLRGACLDVFAREPLPADSPLWGMDNVLITPHSASTAAAENRLITDLFIDNLRRWLAGAPLRNVYNPEHGY